MAANSVYDTDADQQAVPSGNPADPRSHYDPQTSPKLDSSDPRGDSRAANRSELGRQESTNDDNGSTKKLSALDAPGLGAAESKGQGGAANSLYNAGIASTGVPGAVFNKVLNFAGKRKKSGAASLIAVAFLVAFISISNGPLEFIHIAQLLEKFHFSAQEDAQDSRLTRIARYARDPSKPENTRLGIVGNSIADKLETKMHDATGLNSAYDSTGQSKGYVVDREHSKFKGMTPEQVKEELIKSGIDPDTITINDGADGKKTVGFDPDKGGKNLLGRYRSQTKISRSLLKQSGLSRFGTIAGTRVLGKRAGWTFHPIKKADSKVISAAAKGGKAARDKLKEQFAKDQLNFETNGAAPPGGEPKALTETSADGETSTTNPTSEQNSAAVKSVEEAAQSSDPTKPDSSSKLSGKLGKIAGGAAGGVGLGCVIRGLSQSIGQERQAKVILPMMRKASQAISLGSQVQSNDDISLEQLGLFRDFLDEKDANGKVVSSWASAASIQYENGDKVTGKDLPESAQVFNKGNPFDFLDGPSYDATLGVACKVLGSTFGTLFGIVTGPISFVISSAVLPHVLGLLTNWLSGAPISPIASGADYGNYINYGARLSANDQYASVGGVPLSAADEVAIKSTDKLLDQQDFQTKNIAYRVFNTRDSRTLAAQFIDKNQTTVSTANVAVSINKLGSMFGSLIKMPAMLIGGSANAAGSSTYNYHGLKKVGFTTEELTDGNFANPFDNGCKVVGGKGCNGQSGILEDADKAAKYTDRVKKCFGINLSFDGTMWVIDSKTESVNFEDQSYPSGDCTESSTEWKRIRFWLLDTATVESYDCITNDGKDKTADTSCADSGYGTASTSSAPTSTEASGSVPTGSASELAKQLEPFINNGKIKCGILGGGNTNCSDITNTANGTSIKGSGGCSVDGLQPELLGMLLKLLQMGHTFSLTAVCTDHHLETGRHSAGTAADFGIIDGVSMSGTGQWGGDKLKAATELDKDVASFMPKTTEFLQQQCHGSFDFLQGFQGSGILGDPCHHQHITAGK